MNPMLSFVNRIMLSCFYLLTMCRFMRAFFWNARKTSVRYVAWAVYYVLQIVPAFGIIVSPLILLVLNALSVFVISTLSYHSSLKKRCIFSVLICAVWMLAEIITDIVLVLLGMEGWWLGTAAADISNMCMFGLAVITGHYVKGKERPDIPLQYTVAVFLVPAGSIYLMHHIFFIVAVHREYVTFAIISSLLLLSVNYMIFGVYEQMTADAEAQERSRLYEQELELLSRQVDEREVYDTEIRRLRHDMRNYMAGLLGMVHEGDREQAEVYIYELLKSSEDCRAQDVSRSGNIVVDTIVNHKCAKAEKEGVIFEANVFLPAGLPFRAGHLAIVFGNLLDNALEACREMEKGERYIRLETFYEKEVLMVTVCNSCEGERRRNRNGKFVTTKRDNRNHGLGLSSVEQAVESYHGQLAIECTDGVFQAVVVMYGENGEKREK